jgi:hypothetical protein
MKDIYDAFGSVPSHIAPSVLVRRWDQGLIFGALAFVATYVISVFLSLLIPGPPQGSFALNLWGGWTSALHHLTLGMTFKPQAEAFAATVVHPWHTYPRVYGSFGLATLAALVAARAGLRPRSNTWHLNGPRLLEGPEALRECRKRSLTRAKQAADSGNLALHPELVLPKRHWSRSTFCYGSVGSGKTVILLPIIRQIIDRDEKLFLYDVKGEFTAKFRRPIIVSPFDARSYVWDVGQDVRTPTQAAAFAASLIPEDSGNGKFWILAAQQLLTGALRALQNENGSNWGWSELAKKVSQSAPDMIPMILAHYPKAAPLIANAESQSTASVLATLAGFTRVIDDLALAWPKVGKRSFSITAWCKDDYTGRKQVIVQSGPDAQLTKAYISAMINVAVPMIISPALKDNESGRFLGFIFDELTSAGKINLPPLIDKGRSKGVVVVACVQDLAQVRQVYGDLEAEAMSGMVGTHIICQVQLGKTRDQLAQMLGKHRVAWRTHEAGASVHEESRALVSPAELTDELGLRQGRNCGPHGWGIKALVQMGGDLLQLTFPGVVLPDVREGQVAARWTTQPAGGAKVQQLSLHADEERQRPVGLTADEIAGFFNPNA